MLKVMKATARYAVDGVTIKEIATTKSAHLTEEAGGKANGRFEDRFGDNNANMVSKSLLIRHFCKNRDQQKHFIEKLIKHHFPSRSRLPKNIGKKLRCVLTFITSFMSIVLAFRRSPPVGVITSSSGFSMIAAFTSSAWAGVAL